MSFLGIVTDCYWCPPQRQGCEILLNSFFSFAVRVLFLKDAQLMAASDRKWENGTGEERIRSSKSRWKQAEIMVEDKTRCYGNAFKWFLNAACFRTLKIIHIKKGKKRLAFYIFRTLSLTLQNDCKCEVRAALLANSLFCIVPRSVMLLRIEITVASSAKQHILMIQAWSTRCATCQHYRCSIIGNRVWCATPELQSW